MNYFIDNLDIYTDTEETVGQASKIGKKCKWKTNSSKCRTYVDLLK